MSAELPHLLYFGDVPVEASYHGSALLHRLLETYPVSRLKIVETGAEVSRPERRLSGVQYRSLPLVVSRWLTSRFHRWARGIGSWSALRSVDRAESEVQDFPLEGILTVAHGFGWLTAAELARSRNVPLHLIVHDDWPRCGLFSSPFDRWIDTRLGHVYRQAATRLCVSPSMRDAYQTLYGPAGTVLYPARGRNCPAFETPPHRLASPMSSPLGVFAGTINSSGCGEQLRALAEALRPVNGRLRVYGKITAADLAAIGLDASNVERGGLLPSDKLIHSCREDADFLFVPLDFAPENRLAMERNFPSKLTDYTAMGLPILIQGPLSSSGVRWGRENPGAALVVDSEGAGALADPVRCLSTDGALRLSLAREALRLGREFFSFEAAETVFQSAIVGNLSPSMRLPNPSSSSHPEQNPNRGASPLEARSHANSGKASSNPP